MQIDLSQMITEGRNPASHNIDELTTEAMLRVINDEDKKVALAVEAILPQIAQVGCHHSRLQQRRSPDLLRRRHVGSSGDSGCQRMSADLRHAAQPGGWANCWRPHRNSAGGGKRRRQRGARRAGSAGYPVQR